MKFDLKMIIEKFNNLDIKARYAALAVCVVVVMGLDYLVLTNFQLRSLSGIDAQVKKIKEETIRVKADTQRIDQIKSGLENSRTQLQALNSKIRSLQEVPAVLEDISRLANESHVQIEQITPSKEVAESLVSSGDVKYYSLPIVIIARSGYHMFGQFLNKLESGDLLFTIRDLSVTQSKGSGSLSIQATLKVILADKAPGVVK